MKWGFLRCRTAVGVGIALAHTTRLLTRIRAKRPSTRGRPRGEKNCPPEGLPKQSTRSFLAQNARISGRPIRKNGRRRRSPRLFHALRTPHAPSLWRHAVRQARGSRSWRSAGWLYRPTLSSLGRRTSRSAFGLALASATLSGALGEDFPHEFLYDNVAYPHDRYRADTDDHCAGATLKLCGLSPPCQMFHIVT